MPRVVELSPDEFERNWADMRAEFLNAETPMPHEFKASSLRG